MKCISVSMSYDCIKEPRCSFCYNRDNESRVFNFCELWEKAWALARQHPDATISFEYSGFGLQALFIPKDIKNPITFTTMPQCVTELFCEELKQSGVQAISISYDSEKVSDVWEWVEAAKKAKGVGLQVGCNFLIEKLPMAVPEEILDVADQLNLLSMKPDGKFSEQELAVIELEIEKYKGFTCVTTDNCLGVQLGLIDECKRGKDFIHVLPNGEIEDCCFKEDCFLFEGIKNGSDF